jgi:endopeptidase La
MDNKISKTEYDIFIKDKLIFFEDVIIKTINSIQEKYLYDIILQNEVKISINDLLSLSKELLKANDIEKLQFINNSLSSIIKQYGTESFSDLIKICYENNSKCHDNFNNDKYNIIKNHFKPINYKILNFNEIKKTTIGKNDKIINSSNLDCIEILSNNDNFYLKVSGITVIIHDINKYIIIDGYLDNLPGHIINNKYINNKLNNIRHYKNTQSYQTYIDSLSIKDLLIYNDTTIINNYNTLCNKVYTLNKTSLVKVIREYLISDSFYQRNITIGLLLDTTNQYSQYLAYLLFDMLSDENNKQYDSKRQTYIYNTLPHNLKQLFKNSIKNTLTYIDELSNLDENKIPLEQQIALLKCNNNVKEKAMQKLKELKSKSEDSGSKSRQYLDGLLKIPFGIYKTNQITEIINKINCTFDNLISSVNLLKNSDKLNKDENLLLAEIINSCWSDECIEKYVINLFDNKFIKDILKDKNNNKNIQNKFDKTKNINNKSRIDVILNDYEIKKYILYNFFHSYDNIKNSLIDISYNYNIVQNKVSTVTTTLDKAIYGHNSAKRQIERIIAQWINGENTGYCLGFEGPPGIGKTSLAKKGIANCLKDDNDESRPFSFIAIGGSCNASTIDGHNYTYVGSTWGKIVDILMEAKCMNPIIFIDELDKVSKSDQGKEIIGVLTHLTDYTQNDSFQDKYFTGIDLDLSKVLFIFSYNDVSAIDKILLDRIHRIKFDVITNDDKIIITNKYILPELYKKMGVIDKINFDDDVILFIIETYTQEPGVRKLKEILFEIVGEINLIALKNEKHMVYPINVTIDDIKNYYLKERFKIIKTNILNHNNIGLINGLWANSLNAGGIMQIQAKFFPSNSKYDLKLTGLQGDVMKESMNVAKSLAYDLVNEFNKDISFNNQAIHVHCPDGSTPKDGPSAGTAITLVIYSLLTNRKIKNDIAITGEINLFGNISQIGGLEFKVMGALKANVKTIIYPTDNQEDIEKIIIKYPITKNLNFISASNIREILNIVFVD